MSNPTGFDLNKFKAAAHPRSEWARRDPWGRGYATPFPKIFYHARLNDAPNILHHMLLTLF